MAKRIKDTEYLALSTRVRAMETSLFSRERLDQLLDARSPEDISKLLQEAGYPELNPRNPGEMDAALNRVREDTFRDLSDGIPNPALLDFFRVPYDYHNAKALLKTIAIGQSDGQNPESSAQAAGQTSGKLDAMFSPLGRISAEALREALESGETDSLPGTLGRALAEAKEILDSTRDPQLSDVCLDRWQFADWLELAQNSPFLTSYVRVQADAMNLRALVRTLRMGKNADFLRGVLVDGGEVDLDAVLSVCTAVGGGLAELYAPTVLRQAAEIGAEVLRNDANANAPGAGGASSMTEFEKFCDNAVSEVLNRARLIPFGEEPVIAYLAARETEAVNLRVILLGKAADIPAEAIRSRLRDAAV